MADPKSLRARLLGTAYVLVPAAGWGLLHGAPIGLVGGIVVCLIWWIRTADGRLGKISPWWMALLIAVKLAAGFFLLADRGLAGDYYANAQWAPPLQQSTEYRARSFTRVDHRLAFGGAGTSDLPLYFLNDSPETARPNAGQPPAFSATWQGYVWVPAAKDRQSFYLRGTDVTAELWVDGAQTVRLDPPAGEAVDRTLWPAGLRRVTVRLVSSEGRSFDAGLVDEAGRKTPFDDAGVFTRQYAPARITLDRVVRALSKLLDGGLLVLLLWLVVMTAVRALRDLRGRNRQDALVAFVWLAAIGWAFLFSNPASGRVVLLGGAPHYLSYERDARALLVGARSIGLGHLYVHFIALSHLVFGEDLSGVYFLQGLMEFAVVLSIWKVSTVLFGTQIGKAGLALATLYFIVMLRPVAATLLSANLFVPLLTALAVLAVDLLRSPTRRPASLVAVVLILAAGVFEGIRLLPALSFHALAGKALFTLGFFNVLAPEAGMAPGLIATWWAALIGAVVVMWGSVPDGLRGASRLVPAALSLGYLALIVLVFPKDNVDRLILPLYILLLPYTALGMMRAVDFLVPPEEE